jgi:hypothetical protein
MQKCRPPNYQKKIQEIALKENQSQREITDNKINVQITPENPVKKD